MLVKNVEKVDLLLNTYIYLHKINVGEYCVVTLLIIGIV